MKRNILFFVFLSVLFISSCYTYNIPSGADTPLITFEGESKVSVGANFNEIGGNFAYGLTEHAVFTSSGNIQLTENNYKQDYDSLFYKKTPNNFEVGFGYYGGIKNFSNMFLFGIGTGNDVYNQHDTDYYYSDNNYYQTNFIQYFLQYTAGFKYQKKRRNSIKYKESGVSLRYTYHDYYLLGITNEISFNEQWNEELQYREYIETENAYKTEENNYFNSFSVYYFYRTGNDKIQF